MSETNRKEYNAGDFCRAVECSVIECFEAGESIICKTGCKAYQFHDYLIKNGYKIVKEVK